MYLTKQECDILEGKFGYSLQKSLEILVALGECYGAQRMIPVASAHLIAGYFTTRKAGLSFIAEIAEKGGKFITSTTTNISDLDPSLLNDPRFNVVAEHHAEQMALLKTLTNMGAFPSQTCTPYLVGHIPRLGQHIAWSESSAVAFANSVLGARTNREGAPSSLAAALTGKTPEYGFHLDQNRYGDLEIIVTAKLSGPHDYGTLGYYIGKVAGDRVPVITGIPTSASLDDLELIGAAAASSGSVSLFHVVGVTPEAPTRQTAFGPARKRWETIEFSEKQRKETEESLSRCEANEVEIVVFGCPHASIEEIRDVARLLSGKRIKTGVELWISTSLMVKAYAEIMGCIDIIESTGARLISSSCPFSLSDRLREKYGPRIVATNSAKMAHYMPSAQGITLHYGSMDRCIEAALSGTWT